MTADRLRTLLAMLRLALEYPSQRRSNPDTWGGLVADACRFGVGLKPADFAPLAEMPLSEVVRSLARYEVRQRRSLGVQAYAVFDRQRRQIVADADGLSEIEAERRRDQLNSEAVP